jgi:hypothetical protein
MTLRRRIVIGLKRGQKLGSALVREIRHRNSSECDNRHQHQQSPRD